MPPQAAAARQRRPQGVNDPVRQARIDLAAAFRVAARMGWQEHIGGHFSLRVPGRDDRILINPMGLLWSEVRASDLIVADFRGNKVEGELPLERTAACIHCHVHAANADAACVIHTHTPYATGLAAVDNPKFEFIHQGGLRFFGDIGYYNEFNGLVTADEEGLRVADAIRGKRAVFLANHGTIVTGPTVGDAFLHTYVLERQCQYLAIARMHGAPLRRVDDETARTTHEVYKTDPLNGEVYFAALKRELDRDEPDYAE
jgi:ribulose-5-phosphate 4-epimerase/fuculose-1-phosphate aldolase